MRIERIIYSVLIIVLAALAAIQWRKAALFSAENEELRWRVETLEGEAEAAARLVEVTKGNSDKLRKQTAELMKLRNEVTQLRGSDKSAESLKSENEELKSELADFRRSAAGVDEQARRSGDSFPRENWSFAGYNSPEAAMVSAIWAMREGKRDVYLASLTPPEQVRMTELWAANDGEAIANKHRNDVATISGLKILERQDLSPTEVVMNVFIEGQDRVEKVRMSQVGNEWKFGGFIREQQQQAQNQP